MGDAYGHNMVNLPYDLNDQQEAAMDAAAAFAVAVERQAYDLRVREAARVKVAAERAGEVPPFDAGLLGELLARPAEPPHRVDGLIPSDAAALIVAARKTGKTTIELNLARSQITGEDFLGRFAVRPITGRVGFLNYEVSGGQIARWADEVGVPRDRLYVVNLRGRRNPLGDPDDRARLAERLHEKEVESLMVDPFGRAYTGQSQNDPGEVGAWLADLDRFARGEAGATDLILSAHAGWNGERTRGASALEDWADVIITLTRDADPDEDGRWLRAFGRDVDVDEDRLHFDASTRSLSLTGAGSRKAAAKVRHVEELIPAVVAVVTAQPGITGYKLQAALRESGAAYQRGDEVKAAKLAAERGLLVIEAGPRNSNKYLPAPHLPPPIPTYPNGTGADLSRPPPSSRGRSAGVVDGPPIPTESLCPDCARNLDTDPAPACGCPDLHGSEVSP